MANDTMPGKDKNNQPEIVPGSENETDKSATHEESYAAPETEVQEELRRAKEELEDYKDRYLRAVAESDNLRKRSAKERADLIKYSGEALMRDLLPVLDSFDKACGQEHADSKDTSFHDGMLLVHKQLHSVLEKYGLKAIEAIGAAFDPNIHQAIQRIDVTDEDTDQEKVAEEFAKGYLMHDRLLRPAMVSVKVPGKKKD